MFNLFRSYKKERIEELEAELKEAKLENDAHSFSISQLKEEVEDWKFNLIKATDIIEQLKASHANEVLALKNEILLLKLKDNI